MHLRHTHMLGSLHLRITLLKYETKREPISLLPVLLCHALSIRPEDTF